METRDRQPVTPQLVLGAFLLLLGALFLLDNLDVLESERFLEYWPVILIAFGLAKAAQSRGTPGRGWGVLIALAGIALLADQLDLVRFDIWEFWPLALVALGASMVWKAIGAGRGAVVQGDPSEVLRAVAILSGLERTSTSQAFRGGELTAIAGGCKVDLRQASIPEGGEAVIETFTLAGGIELRVPEDWTVVPRVTPILGGFEDTTRPPKAESKKRLVVRGVTIMGGVKVTN